MSIQPLRLQKAIVTLSLRKPFHLFVNTRTIPRPVPLPVHPIILRQQMRIIRDQLMRRLIGGRLITIDQPSHRRHGRLFPPGLPHMRKRLRRPLARLYLTAIPIDRPPIQPRRSPRLEPPQRKAEPFQRQGQSDRGGFHLLGIAEVSSPRIAFAADHEDSAEEGAGGEDDGGGFDFEAGAGGGIYGEDSADARPAVGGVGGGGGEGFGGLDSLFFSRRRGSRCDIVLQGVRERSQ
mmetsp:Transcript_4785/g.10551  ORF Transcript_4785/g.10551 Transcript_4785/m.10551 type:complete len:235 (-) Transcript_4785:137-841(-)